MENIVSVLALIIGDNIGLLSHRQIFSHENVSFYCQEARHPRPNLPRDAKDFRILVEFAAEEGELGWELELLAAVRGPALWNPAARLVVKGCRANDTDDESIILARAEEWCGQW
ncbi:MAG TPA: hypothetical protein VIU82_20025 [Bosea sp. (in: a-proteobacteria)]